MIYRAMPRLPACETLERRTLFASSFQVVGYLPDYHYAAVIHSLDWSALTQINYFSFAPSAATGRLPSTSTSGFGLSQLSAAAKLAHRHHVKIDVVIGGDGYDSSIAHVAANPSLRTAFADSARALCTKFGLNGIDLDYEPQNPTAAQLTNYASLIHTLHTRAPSLDLSAAVNAEKLPIASSTRQQYIVSPQALHDLTSINVMAYDLDFANHSTFAQSTHDLHAWANYLAANHLPKTKLLLGLPFYGRAGTSWDNTTAESYADITSAYANQTHKSPPTNVDHLTVALPDAFNNQPVTWYFNSPATIAAKTHYARQNAYAGIMIWDLGQDAPTHPLLSATAP